MGLLKNIRMAREAVRITSEGWYGVGGNRVALPGANFRAVEVIRPDDGATILANRQACPESGDLCTIRVFPEDSFQASVVSVPAPNRRGAALFASNRRIAEAMSRRIRIMLLVAARHGHRNLVLGAWGCGAFGNKPRNVAGLFKRVLVDEGLGGLFDEVCFAIRGRTDSENYRAFKEIVRNGKG